MKRPTAPLSQSRRGVALIIVLAFVVLLTGIIIAFFSRATSGRRLSDSSLHQAQAAQLAHTATDIIVGDLMQEIVAGSDATVVPGGFATIYRPKTPADMLPRRNVTFSGVDPFPNLVRISKRSDTIPSPAIASRASASNSTADVSINGRHISPERWNKHYLLPRKNTGTTVDTSPVDAFGAIGGGNLPDWVFVTNNDGARAITAPSPDVIGRYAFAIYDEGGLLDVNAAGAPSGLTPEERSFRISTALADMTQLLTTEPTDTFPQQQVDNLVGWRNYATAQPGGSFGIFNFDPAAATRYLEHLSKQETGFLTASKTEFNGRTDQIFTSRQMLIDFQRATGFSQNALQYLTHFSRGLEQPSFIPNPERPKIVGSGLPTDNVTNYQGNNDYYGRESAINMVGVGGFLSARVQNTFVRPDGTTALIGEPLVKRKFGLNNLSLVTTSATASKSATDPIYSRFGLYRSSASEPWMYNHGMDQIMTLSQVSALSGSNAREPDFAELLKAAINAGSVGKGAFTNQGANFSYSKDVVGDRQILQIMANLIDQTKTDNYVTAIKPFDNSASNLAIYGVQDLPYFYNYHYFGLTTKTPSPLLDENDTVLKSVLDPSKTGTANHIREGVLNDPGSASYMIIPQIWRPHDANSPVPTGGGPTQFRIIAETTDPTGTLGYWKISATPGVSPGAGGEFPAFDGASDMKGLNSPTSARSSAKALNSSNSVLNFTDSTSGRAFREPTLLWRDGNS